MWITANQNAPCPFLCAQSFSLADETMALYLQMCPPFHFVRSVLIVPLCPHVDISERPLCPVISMLVWNCFLLKYSGVFFSFLKSHIDLG